MTTNITKKKLGNPKWGNGVSGNPAGRPVDPARKEALELLKKAAPEIVQKAISMVLCDEPNVVVMTALIKKIFPDNINLGSDPDNPLITLLRRIDGKGLPKPGV